MRGSLKESGKLDVPASILQSKIVSAVPAGLDGIGGPAWTKPQQAQKRSGCKRMSTHLCRCSFNESRIICNKYGNAVNFRICVMMHGLFGIVIEMWFI